MDPTTIYMMLGGLPDGAVLKRAQTHLVERAKAARSVPKLESIRQGGFVYGRMDVDEQAAVDSATPATASNR